MVWVCISWVCGFNLEAVPTGWSLNPDRLMPCSRVLGTGMLRHVVKGGMFSFLLKLV